MERKRPNGIVPALHEDLVVVQQKQRTNRPTVWIPGEELANGSNAVQSLHFTIVKGPQRALENRVAGEKPQNPVQQDRRIGVPGGKVSRDLGGREERAVAGSGQNFDEVKLQSRFQSHRKNDAVGQANGQLAQFFFIFSLKLQFGHGV